MSQITDNARVLSSVQTAQLFTVNRDAALIRIFSEKCLAESRFSARTAPVTPIISPGFASREMFSNIFSSSGYANVSSRTDNCETVRISGFSFSITGFISGLIRFHETCALCTALNNFAALEDLTDSFVKQDKNVVKIAAVQTFQPVPSTFAAPKYKINSTPVIEMTL